MRLVAHYHIKKYEGQNSKWPISPKQLNQLGYFANFLYLHFRSR